MARTKKASSKEELADTDPSGDDSDGESLEPMKGPSDNEDVDDDSKADDSITNEGDESTVDTNDGNDDDSGADAPSVEGPEEQPSPKSPREVAKVAPSRTKTQAWKNKVARIAKMDAAKAKAAKAKAATAKAKATKAKAPPKKRIVKGHWSGYNGKSDHHIHAREIADAIQLCCDTSDAATTKFLVEGWDNAQNIAEMTDKDSVRHAVANVRKPGGGSSGNMVSIFAEHKLQVFAFTVRYLRHTQQDIDFTEWSRDFLDQYQEYWDIIKDAPHDLTKAEIPVLGTDVIDGPKLFEFFDDVLGTSRTPCGAMYSYVTRDCILSIEESDDPFGFFERFEEGVDNAHFASMDEEHVRRRRIIKKWCQPHLLRDENIEELEKCGPYMAEFKKDSAALAAYLRRILEKKHPMTWSLIRDACKKGRGREAYFILKGHLLGNDHIERMVAALENEISQLSWSAQDAKKTLPWFVAKHASFHSRASHLEATTTSYRGLSEEAKMRYFLHGIKGRELEVPLAVIKLDVSMKNDFTKASTFLMNSVRNDPRFKKVARIAGVGARQGGGGGRGRGRGGGRGGGRSPQGRGKKRDPPNDWDEAKVLGVIDRIRDRYFRNPDDSKTFVPTSDYSRFDGNERQATWRCREERRTRTQPPRGVSALAVPPPPPPPPPPRGPPGVHVDHVAYSAMVAEITQLREDKRLRLAAKPPYAHAPMPPGKVRSDRPTDQSTGSMFSGRPGTG